MEESMHGRIQQFIDYLGITNNQFARSINESSARISQVTHARDGNAGPDFRVSLLMKILGHFPELSSDWLLMGEGPMLKSAEANRVPLETELRGLPPQPMVGWKARLLAAHEAKQTIPLVEQKAYASYLAGFIDQDYLESRPVIYYPDLRGMGPVIAIRVQGESMCPTIYPDDVLLCSYIEPDQAIKENTVHVVCHNEGVVVKRVQDRTRQEGALICKSDNREYPTFSVRKEHIQHIWRVRRRITAYLDPPDPRPELLDERMEAMESQLSALRNQLDQGPRLN